MHDLPPALGTDLGAEADRSRKSAVKQRVSAGRLAEKVVRPASRWRRAVRHVTLTSLGFLAV